MIVNEDYRRRVLRDRFSKHFAWMHEGRVQQSAGDRDVTLETMLRIEDRDVKLLDGKILQPLAEDLVNVLRTADGDPVLTLLRSHSSAKLQRGVDRDCSGGPDATDRRERTNRLRRQSPQRAVGRREDIVPDSQGGMFL
jgi:hypothetical protein